MKKITIAIDGFSSCGKSTMAKDLAKEIGYIYIDSGAMYRAVTLYAMQHNLFDESGNVNLTGLEKHIGNIHIEFRLDAQTSCPQTFLNGVNVEREIRGMDVSNRVSMIATIGFVRQALVGQQQEMGKKKGIVMDGRDIGTAVFPEAEMKIYVTASAEVRAQRRYDELKAKGQPCDYQDIYNNVVTRDKIDMGRAISPLRKAEDALELDNSHLTPAEQKAWLIEQYRRIAAE
ncbi:MAG: (d)CMP kinase [Clostridium sp.]|nr:(d)CMP kinase [Clostridium sp.]